MEIAQAQEESMDALDRDAEIARDIERQKRIADQRERDWQLERARLEQESLRKALLRPGRWRRRLLAASCIAIIAAVVAWVILATVR